MDNISFIFGLVVGFLFATCLGAAALWRIIRPFYDAAKQQRLNDR